MATLLYVDDEEAIGRAVRLWLTRKGHVVHLATDAASAREIVMTAQLDGIFLDLWLGADSGLELYRWIDALDPALGSRVAFVTGDLFDRHLGNQLGDRPVFTKPFELRELEELATAWSRQGQAARHRSEEPRQRPNPG